MDVMMLVKATKVKLPAISTSKIVCQSYCSFPHTLLALDIEPTGAPHPLPVADNGRGKGGREGRKEVGGVNSLKFPTHEDASLY